MSGVATAIGLGVASIGVGIYGANKAAGAQESAANAASNTQLTMYNQSRADQAPWRQAGGQALNALSQWYGLGGVGGAGMGDPNAPAAGTPSAPQGYDPSSGYQIGAGGGISQLARISGGISARPTVTQGMTAGGQPTTGPAPRPGTGQQPVDYQKLLSNLPGYQFQLQQGSQAVDQNLAARGLLQSGAAGKELTQFGQGLASSYATQYVAGLQSMAGLGQTAAAQTGAFGANAANQIGGNMLYGGNAQASGYVGQANAINSGLSNLAGIYGRYQQQQNPYDQLQPVSVGGQYAYDPYSPWAGNPGG